MDLYEPSFLSASSDRELPHLVVVGNGMAGVACVEEILKYDQKFRVTIFGAETHPHYNRGLLSSVLAGEKSMDDITLHPVEWYREKGVVLRLGVRIVDVDGYARTVTSEDRSVTRFDRLLLATGSSPVIPPFEGARKNGVFAFHNLTDTRELLERSATCVKAVVIGGGLLGLEAARGLQIHGCEVTVVYLMPSPLDSGGGSYVTRKMEELGMRVVLNRRPRALLGNEQVEGVEFFDGTKIDANLVVIAAGSRPNVDLGLCAGLTVNLGIVVNDYMETSHPDIFAVGECVEHRGVCHGLGAALFEQGKVLAATITGNRGPVYEGTVQPSAA